jgi:hypothetical protein
MTRILLSFLALVSLSTLLSSCKKLVGSGPVVTEQRNGSGFSGVNLSIDATVNITEDSIYSIEVMAQQNILDLLKTQVDGSTLCINYGTRVNVIPTEDVTINLHMPAVSSLNVSGSGDINAAQPFSCGNLSMDVSGSGIINLNKVDAQSINANISGSGKVTVNAGSSNIVTTKISGSGKVNLMDVMANAVSTNTSGSGTTRVFAIQTLNAKISGSGDVYYKGSPVVTSSISGSGKLIHQN